LGEFASKDDVRDLAKRWNMHTKDKKDSMGICFVGIRKGFSGFLGESPKTLLTIRDSFLNELNLSLFG